MLKVAIAEDDFRVAGVHEKFLSKVGDIEIVGKVLNASETMELLESREVDLLLLDIYMPDALGTDLLPEIHKRFPGVDILMITAAADRTFLEHSVRNGIVNYLIKPVTLEQFTKVIQEYRKRKEMLENRKEIDQQFVDYFIGTNTNKGLQKENLPKGIDPLTLTKVKEILAGSHEGISAEEMSVRMGASRTTARRYLEYLICSKEAKAELEYGIVGRPERKYYSKEPAS